MQGSVVDFQPGGMASAAVACLSGLTSPCSPYLNVTTRWDLEVFACIACLPTEHNRKEQLSICPRVDLFIPVAAAQMHPPTPPQMPYLVLYFDQVIRNFKALLVKSFWHRLEFMLGGGGILLLFRFPANVHLFSVCCLIFVPFLFAHRILHNLFS